MTRIAPATPENIAAAAACLREGGLVAMPTETVYGLAALATSDAAAAAIYAAKGRPAFNPLIAHFTDVEAVAREAVLDPRARALAAAFWPGPLTIVAPVAAGARISLLARAGLNTIATRVPRHETALALIAAAGAPLVAPSANRSGRVSPTRADHVAADLADRVTGSSTRALRRAGSNPRLWPVSTARFACSVMGRFRARSWRKRWERRSNSPALPRAMGLSRPARSPRITRRARRCD